MVVPDSRDLDRGHVGPIEPAVRFPRYGLARPKNQTAPSVQVERELTRAVVFQLVASAWERSHLLQARGGRQIVEARPELLRSDRAQFLLRSAIVVAERPEIVVGEQDVQEASREQAERSPLG